jgi:hypothetical protein
LVLCSGSISSSIISSSSEAAVQSYSCCAMLKPLRWHLALIFTNTYICYQVVSL